MRKNKYYGMYCFTPPIMIATFVIEILFAIIAILRGHHKTKVGQLGIILLVLLALFQLSEFIICTDVSINSKIWAQIGFVVITFLPPIGLHLAYVIARKKHALITLPYMAGFIFALVVILFPTAIERTLCGGNYMLSVLNQTLGYVYGVYYNGLLLLGVYQTWHFAEHFRTKETRSKLLWLMVGYLVFMVPTGIVVAIMPHTLYGIPSIMCGFAVLLAVILYLKILKP